MNVYEQRMNQIVHAVAEKAWNQPLLPSGLWFHGDVRDNFYYASYLFAAAVDSDSAAELPFERREAKKRAEQVLDRVLGLQQRDPDRPMYGHWPLNLDPEPDAAAPHELPVELMGSLMAWFRRRYEREIDGRLAAELEASLEHIYRGGFYRKPLTVCNHHEAKYTAAKLIFGQLFKDSELLEDGKNSLKETLRRLRMDGMAEYGCLPWFWHWVQAFNCALEFAEDPGLRGNLEELLDELWSLRAAYYLRGAWAGARSRAWPHDAPKDGNPLHDFVQFGDFELPVEMPRTEYAGFLFYEAPEAARQKALQRSEPSEVRKVLRKTVDGTKRELHSYAYVTEHFAAGGLWERVREFDNEQLRWMFSLPVRQGGKGNQLYFFRPGEGYDPSGLDPRHQSGRMEVLYHQNVTLALFPPRERNDDREAGEVVGVLPEGEWICEPEALFGKAEGVLFAVFLSGRYEIRPMSGYSLVVCSAASVGVVVEALPVKEADQRGVRCLEDFAAWMAERKPAFELGGTSFAVDYNGVMTGDTLSLAGSSLGDFDPLVNGQRISFGNYTV
ncbi:hypothetical protein [Paenibacillus sp. DYY-L-2]|uniref:hypothetical protein n=1 Tax=Paenibacillus sp. DYY-L-2 TaxID=3447013 RepID=UPI003F508E7E